jgi:hypothetical protein
MALGSSAVAANAPPIAVAFAPCSKSPNPAPNAALLIANIAAETSSPILLKERKLDLLSHSKCAEKMTVGNARDHSTAILDNFLMKFIFRAAGNVTIQAAGEGCHWQDRPWLCRAFLS